MARRVKNPAMAAFFEPEGVRPVDPVASVNVCGAQSTRFQEFAREANTGRQFRFFVTRGEAINWLGAG